MEGEGGGEEEMSDAQVYIQESCDLLNTVFLCLETGSAEW